MEMEKRGILAITVVTSKFVKPAEISIEDRHTQIGYPI